MGMKKWITREDQYYMRSRGILYRDMPNCEEEMEMNRLEKSLKSIFGYGLNDKSPKPKIKRVGVK